MAEEAVGKPPTNEELLEEIKTLVEDMDDLSDDVGVSFWDGADIIIWIVAAILAVVGFLAAAETGGLSLLLSALGILIAAIDIVVKLAAMAEDEAEKRKADDIERRLRDLERQLRDRLRKK